MSTTNTKSLFPLAIALMLPVSQARAQVAVEVILQEDEVVPGTQGKTVSSLHSPFLNRADQVGTTGKLDGGNDFLWINRGVVSQNVDAPFTVQLPNGLGHGVTKDGAPAWIAVVRFDFTTWGLWTHNGILARTGTVAPHAGGQAFKEFDRVSMAQEQETHILATLLDGSNILYRLPDGTLDNATPVLRSGDTRSGFTISRLSKNFQFSKDGSHHIVAAHSGTTQLVVVNGAAVAQSGKPSGLEGDWESFTRVAINNQGHYLFAGKIDADSNRDSAIAIGGAVALREGDAVADTVLKSPAELTALSINNQGHVAYTWNLNAGPALFFACDAQNLKATSRLVFKRGDEVDIDGQPGADATIQGFKIQSNNANALALTEDFHVFIIVTLRGIDSGLNQTTLVRVPVTCCGDGIVSDTEDCDDAGASSECNIDCSWSSCGDQKINTEDDEVCDDGAESKTCNEDCTPSECGDGKINSTDDEVCDDKGESPQCNHDCTLRECGDGKINRSAKEECDANGIETELCDVDCTLPRCGDGVLNVKAGELCDEGDESKDCNHNCTPSRCGDGILNRAADEECDDGGQNSIGCDADCTYAWCGDGTLNELADEECDDGNRMDQDGCSKRCTTEFASAGGDPLNPPGSGGQTPGPSNDNGTAKSCQSTKSVTENHAPPVGALFLLLWTLSAALSPRTNPTGNRRCHSKRNSP